MKCNETQGKWCKNKHGASKIIDTLETYQKAAISLIIRDETSVTSCLIILRREELLNLDEQNH
jgi:hypothetical protein